MQQLTIRQKIDEQILKGGIPSERANELIAIVVPVLEDIKKLDDQYLAIINSTTVDEKTMTAAREMRLKVRRYRTSIDKVRKAKKEFYLRAGKAIDGIAGIIKYTVSEMEEKLLYVEETEKRRQQEIAKEAKAVLRVTRAKIMEEEIGHPFVHDTPLEDLTISEFNALVEQKKEQLREIARQKKAATKQAEERKKLEEALTREREEKQRLDKEVKRLEEEVKKADSPLCIGGSLANERYLRFKVWLPLPDKKKYPAYDCMLPVNPSLLKLIKIMSEVSEGLLITNTIHQNGNSTLIIEGKEERATIQIEI